MKREFLQLCHKFDPKKNYVGGWYLSEKLDGIRVFYDGGITRGVPANEIPWANVEKDDRLKERSISTGLWSRYAKVIHAPKSWLDKLPTLFLDGELYLEPKYGSWQTLSSIIKKHNPNEDDWAQVKFMALDSPTIDRIFADGMINTTNFKKIFHGIKNWLSDIDDISLLGDTRFEFIYDKLKGRLLENNNFKVHNQIVIPLRDSVEFINEQLNKIVKQGGEGVVLRNPSSIWEPCRSHNLLKYKPTQDAEAIVIGYIFGRRTKLGSKLLGLMGAMITSFKGQRLELSGFTDEERQLIGPNVEQLGEKLAGKEVPPEIMNPMFPRGSKITIRYRELSDSGIPKECVYLRKFN